MGHSSLSPLEQPAESDRGLSAFRPIRLRSAADEVLAVVVDAIRGGLYAPGDSLPRERDLAAQLQVSRTVVREAIAALRQAGIVTVRRGNTGGTAVADTTNLPQVLARIAGETRFELRSVLEVRRGLESQAALLATERATAGDEARLSELVELLPELVGQHQPFYEADVRFHMALGEVSRNELLAALVRDTFNRLAIIRQSFPHAHVDFEQAIVNQRTLLAAVRSRDPERVLATMDEHLCAFERVMLGRELTFFRFADRRPGGAGAAPDTDDGGS
jgi:DNA-binding FadR family transcriptional regulator